MILDFLGIAYALEDLVEGTATNGNSFAFRVIRVTDKSKCEYKVKVWGSLAKEFALTGPTAVAIRRAKIEEYQSEKPISVAYNTLCWVNIITLSFPSQYLCPNSD